MVKTKPVKKEKSKTKLRSSGAKIEKKAQSSLAVKKTVKDQKEKYFEGIGRRKTAIARVRLISQKEKGFSVNGKTLADYFPMTELQKIAQSPLDLMDCLEQFKVSVRVSGGGMTSQAGAIRHGAARALVLFNADSRKKLKGAGYLKRDPRMRERKKFGLKRARRAPQWAKR
jgi:small subunit ribosomal protein S9